MRGNTLHVSRFFTNGTANVTSFKNVTFIMWKRVHLMHIIYKLDYY
jgi:hypothetical protein